MDRQTALKVVEEHAKSDSLRKHLGAVEECMRAYARKEGEDEELWGIAGLVHDFDWEVCPTPESHPTFGAEILRSNGFPETIVRAVLSHGNHTGIARETLMEKALFACDELSGFVTAGALVRPTKSLSETSVRSVRRKFKDKRFDIVVALGFFEYVGPHQDQKFVEISRILNRDGKFIMSYINFRHFRIPVFPATCLSRRWRRDLSLPAWMCCCSDRCQRRGSPI